MALEVDSHPVRDSKAGLDPAFANRLEESLERADHLRTRAVWLNRARAGLLLLILIVPVIFWRLGGATHDGLGASINALAWLAFLLDVGVHVNTGFLAYLGLGALPAAVGCLIFALVSITLLGKSEET